MQSPAETKVSVIIPSFNHEWFVEEAVRSVLCQTYGNLEMIVVDDGSTDDSVRILRTMEDPRLRVVQQRNQGAHTAINNGLDMANGEILCILNSDDRFHPERIERALKTLEERPDTQLVCSWIDIVDDSGKRLDTKKGWSNFEPWPLPKPEERIGTTGSFYSELMISNFVASTSNIVMTRDLWKAIGPMRPLRFVHDWDFLLRAARRSQCLLIEEPLLQYRIHPSNTIRSNRSEMIFEVLWLWASHLAELEDDLLRLKEERNGQVTYDVFSLYHSLNCQGHDRIFWALRSYMDTLKRNGVVEPELAILHDNMTKSKIISLIEENDSLIVPEEGLRCIWKKLVGIASFLGIRGKA
ncbi:MAG: glycosyltransferase [Pseudomonadota bacterium]